MTEKQIERLFRTALNKMPKNIEMSYDKCKWIFLEAFKLGAEEAQRIYKS